jgi:hypothetical protein
MAERSEELGAAGVVLAVKGVEVETVQQDRGIDALLMEFTENRCPDGTRRDTNGHENGVALRYGQELGRRRSL